jgi:hypothetical protein
MARQEVDFIRKSPFTGNMNKVTMLIDLEDYKKWREGGELIQRAMPYLTASEREFLMTGYTQEDWDGMFNNKKAAPPSPPQGGADHA